MKLMLKIKIMPLLLCSMLMLSCNDWLDVEPTGVQTDKTFWKTKEEVEGVLMSSYIQLRRSHDRMLMWGELLGNGVSFGPEFKETGLLDMDKVQIRELAITPYNYYAEYDELYKGISYANHVIELAPGVMSSDVTLTPALLDSYIAEAVFLRSLYYFYLVRVFKDVPYIKEAYNTDDKGFRVNSTNGEIILLDVLVDLKKYATKCKPGYEVEWQSKGRATSWACYALIADISLWVGDYAEAITYCKKFEGGGFSLVEMDEWISIYYPGNSVESIFELQYDHELENQRGSLYDDFWGGEGKFVVSKYMRDVFMSISQKDIDVRGLNWGFTLEQGKLWKYGGTANEILANPDDVRASHERSPNFIFYRYADILFIQAEALIMQNMANIGDAFELLDQTVRKRAGYREKLALKTSQAEALKLIVDERLKEFVGEGKSWFDILRMSRVASLGIPYLKESLLEHVPSNQRSIKNNDLNDIYSHYLPIHLDEIVYSSGVLDQNPFYQKFTEDILK